MGKDLFLDNDNETEENTLQWVTFRLADEIYGINVMEIQEVLRLSEITPVPGSPNFILGIVNLRGNVVTVLDTRLRFGLASSPPTVDTRIIIAEINGKIIGLLVDKVTEVMNLKASQIESTSNISYKDSARFYKGVYSTHNYLLILIDLNKLIVDDIEHF